MLKSYIIENGCLHEAEGALDIAGLRKARWIDLCNPGDDEIALVEDAADIALDAANDYEPFQVSSHFAVDENQLTMTGLVLMLREGNEPHLLKVTFISGRGILVTVSEGGPEGLGALIKEGDAACSH